MISFLRFFTNLNLLADMIFFNIILHGVSILLAIKCDHFP